MRRILIAALALLTLSAALTEGFYSDPLRLHIVAASDSAADQGVKLAVRDAVLVYAAADMQRTASKTDAVQYARMHLRELESCANTALSEAGMDYSAHACLGEYEFPEKNYGRLVYKAGEYTALRIVLGDGKGQNWWCVLYPPLCVTGKKKTRRQLRFYTAELFGRLLK